jgi:hypothetical protein
MPRPSRQNCSTGFTLRSDANIVRYPDRYMNECDVVVWNEVMSILEGIETEEIFWELNQTEKLMGLPNQNAHR